MRIIGGNKSTIRARTTMIDPATGEQIGESVIISGDSGNVQTTSKTQAMSQFDLEMI
jgi:hypothetical protein